MASKEDGESCGFLPIKKKGSFLFSLAIWVCNLNPFFFLQQDLMYIVGSIYIKREPIIVLIEQDSGHEMGFGFDDLISKMVREKLFFNMLVLILFLLWHIY